MKALNWLKSRYKRLIVISLDGVPFSLINAKDFQLQTPFMRLAFQKKPPIRMYSTLPPLSSVAWSTYMTGKNPGQHGIFGFVDRSLKPLTPILPNRRSIAAKSLWKFFSEENKKVLIINVPMTYPPEVVNGILISGFLGVSPEKSIYPHHLHTVLKNFNYIIDVDRDEKDVNNPIHFVRRLKDAVRARFKLFIHFFKNQHYDFSHLHIMETDRLFHFHWNSVISDADTELKSEIDDFFHIIDSGIEEVFSLLSKSDEMILLSDHGFCKSNYEIQINKILEDEGYLHWRSPSIPGQINIDPRSTAYSLLPGRIYLNLKGREPDGKINPSQADYHLKAIHSSLKNSLAKMHKSEIIKSFLFREDIFKGEQLNRAPDAVIVPHHGYELKSKLEPVDEVIYKSALEGMHTEDDAFVWSLHRKILKEIPHIVDLYPTILNFFNLKDASAEGEILW